MNYREYALPGTLEEAWQLNQRRGNHILGGGMWLRMRKAPFHTAIDLSALPLHEIEDAGDSLRIGAMVPLHELETSAALNALCGGGFREALRGIVGVQFRNCATAGGSIFPRFGFSDVLTLFLALDADVALYRAGTMPLADFLDRPSDGDILTHISVRKRPVKLAYLSQRNAATDFPVLTCAVSEIDGVRFACVGARPGRARRVECPAGMCAGDFAAHVQEALNFGSNLRASETYRRRIAGVLVRRGCEQIERCAE